MNPLLTAILELSGATEWELKQEPLIHWRSILRIEGLNDHKIDLIQQCVNHIVWAPFEVVVVSVPSLGSNDPGKKELCCCWAWDHPPCAVHPRPGELL